MAAVRAKFKVTRIETQTGMARTRDSQGALVRDSDRNPVYGKTEQRTIVLHPVYSSEADDENAAFWDATPTGEIRLGTVNPKAWEAFELDKEYYIDFTPAP